MSEQKVKKNKGAKKVVIKKAPKPGLSLDASGGAQGVYNPHLRPTAFSEPARYKASYSRVDPECQSLCDMITDPESCESTVRWPGSYGLSSTYKSMNIIGAKFGTDLSSCVIAYPRLHNSIYYTSGKVSGQELVQLGTSGHPTVYQLGDNSSLESSGNLHLTQPLYFNDGTVSIPVPYGNGVTRRYLYPFTWAAQAANTNQVDLAMSNIHEAAVCKFNLEVLDESFNVIHSADASISASGGAAITLNGTASTQAGNARYLAFFVNTFGYQWAGSMRINIIATATPNITVNLPNVETHCAVIGLQGAEQITNNAECYFIPAFSCLITNTTSMLQNGGNISICSLPRDTNLMDNTGDIDNLSSGSPLYSWCAERQNCKYDGPTRTGAYCFLTGDSEDFYFYKNVNELFSEVPYIAASFSTTDITSTVRIKVVAHVQFKSNSNVYAQLPSPYFANQLMIPHILSLINTCYSNEGHVDGLKKALKGTAKQIGKVLMTPKTWMTVAEILAMLAL